MVYNMGAIAPFAIKIGIVILVMVMAVWSILEYGSTKEDAGYSRCHAEQASASVQAATKSAKQLERIHNETSHMSDSAIDDDLRKLGIMRSDTDR